MKVFVIDPEDYSAPMPGFLTLGTTRAGWNVYRPDVLRQGMEGTAWLARLRDKLEEADIIIGLGNFLALMQSGTELSSILDQLRQKIDSGCPVLFDGCNSLVNNSFPDAERQILGLLGYYGIHINSTKVASTVRDYEAHSSSMCCMFCKDDDTLLDPRLFSGVDEISGSSNRLIQYDSDVFPTVEASDFHFFVDEGDLLSVGNLGRKNTVAVRLAYGRPCLLAMSGNYLRDRTTTLGGIAPGFEDNRKFAENVIDELSGSVRRPVDYSLSAYEQFCKLEATLGDVIKAGLVRLSGSGDIYGLLPNEVRGRVRGNSGVLDYGRAMFRDLVVILDHRWSDFQPYFIDETGETLPRETVTELLFEINKLRKYLAHPVKALQAGRAVEAADVAKLTRALQLLRGASAQASSHASA